MKGIQHIKNGVSNENIEYINNTAIEEVEELIDNFHKAIELLKLAKEDVGKLTDLADGYENDYVLISEFLSKFKYNGK